MRGTRISFDRVCPVTGRLIKQRTNYQVYYCTTGAGSSPLIGKESFFDMQPDYLLQPSVKSEVRETKPWPRGICKIASLILLPHFDI